MANGLVRGLLSDPLYTMLKALEKREIPIVYFANKALIARSPKTGEIIKFVKGDKAYISFLQIVRKRKSKYYPKLLAFKKLTKGPYKGIYVIKMESLLPLTNEEFSENIFPLTKQLVVYADTASDNQFKIENDKKVASIKDQKFVEAVRYLYTHKPAYAKWDLTIGNAMKRENGTMVIIDPYFEY